MAKKTFELYTLKDSQWQLDCVFNEKQDATNEAWRIHNEGRFEGVRVVQEVYDSTTNEAKVTTILNRLKGEEKKSSSRRKTSRHQHQAHTRVKSAKKPTPANKKQGAAGHIGMMIVSVCIVLLALVGIAFYIVDRF